MDFTINSIKVLAALAVVTMLSSSSSLAATIVLDFEGVGDMAQISDYYNGGTDGQGNAGIGHGVTFSNTASGISDIDANPDYHGNFANEPSGNTALIFREGGVAAMNVAKGFKSTFSLFYSSRAPVTISIFDGLDGTGKQLATLTGGINFDDNNCSGDKFGDFCHWDHKEIKFDGLAKSVIFGGLPEHAYYDDIKFGKAELDPITIQNPIPGAFWLMGSALLGLFMTRRKKFAG